VREELGEGHGSGCFHNELQSGLWLFFVVVIVGGVCLLYAFSFIV